VFEYILVILLVFEQSQLKQVEDDYKDRLEKEFSARKQFEKVFYSLSAWL
jgi:hypothetical protein